MPKKLIKRYLPTPEKIKALNGLGFLGRWLQNPAIWHLHRHSVSKAFLIGLFWMSIPIPSQMLVAALFAIIFRANLPLSVALVWITNPLTMGPIFYFNYLVGTQLLGYDTAASQLHFELTLEWMLNTLGDVWIPLYLGSIVMGTFLGVAGYFTVNLLWRLQVLKNWESRRRRKWQKKFKKENKLYEQEQRKKRQNTHKNDDEQG